MRNTNLLDEYFGSVAYRHVRLGEEILAGDVFIVDGLKLHNAREIGKPRRQDHWPHYRKDCECLSLHPDYCLVHAA